MFNSKDIQKELEKNHKIALSDSSIAKKMKDMRYCIQLQLCTQTFKN